MATPVPLTDLAMERNLQSMQDTQRRALLLRAQAGAMRRQQRGLQDPTQRLQNQLKRLQDIERWASGVRGASLTSLGVCPFLETQCYAQTPSGF